jgi:hypothetical protein
MISKLEKNERGLEDNQFGTEGVPSFFSKLRHWQQDKLANCYKRPSSSIPVVIGRPIVIVHLLTIISLISKTEGLPSIPTLPQRSGSPARHRGSLLHC